MVVSILKSVRSIIAAVILLGISYSTQAAFMHDQSLKWQTLETRHFSIHYHTGAKTIALKAAKISETFLDELQSLFDWIPQSKVDIIISDEADFSNGFVMPFLPNSRMTLLVNPPDEASSFNFQDWFRFLIKHEITHTLHLDKAHGPPKVLRHVFGNHPLLYPGIYQHKWLIEGIATFVETDPELQIGRGQGSEFAMMMRSEVLHGIKPLRQLNSTLSSWPLGRANYLYGYYFFEFLNNKYGRDSIKQLIHHYSNNLIPFNLNEAFVKTYNQNIEELWTDFDAYLGVKFWPQINEIKSNGIVSGVRLTTNGYLKQYAEFIDRENILIGQYNAENKPSLYTLNVYDGSTEHLTNIQTDSRVDYHETSGLLIAQQEVYRNTNMFYDIYKLSPSTKKMQRLTRGQRMRRAIWSPDGKQIVVVFSKLGQHNLALLEADGKIIDILWEAQDGELISDIDWSPDGKHLVASIKRNTTTWNLEEFSLDAKIWNPLTHHQALEAQAKYTTDGKYIVYSADYDGVFNIYRLNRQTQKIEKLTNVIGGAYHPTLSNNGNLLYIGYTTEGFDVFRLEQVVTLTELDRGKLKIPLKNTYRYKDFGFEIRKYNPIKQFAPKWWEPRAYFGEESRRIGAFTTGSDALFRHNYDALIEWDFDAKKSSIEFNYSYDRWLPLIQTRIKSRKREDFTHEDILLEALTPFLSRDNRWFLSTSLSYENDTSLTRDAQNNLIETEARNRLIGLGIVWDSRLLHPRSHSVSDGRLLTAAYESSALSSNTNKGQMLSADWREYINLNSLNILSLRLTGGLGIKTPRPFELGGVYPDSDSFEHSFYSTVNYRTNFYNKRRYPLRGYTRKKGQLTGRRMLLTGAEWRFHIANIERGFPVFPLALNKFSGTLFYNSASVWNTGLKPKKFHHAIGAEIIADTQWFVLFPVQWRLGVATGFSDIGEDQIYLSVGSSF